jgi:hypothetical protein
VSPLYKRVYGGIVQLASRHVPFAHTSSRASVGGISGSKNHVVLIGRRYLRRRLPPLSVSESPYVDHRNASSAASAATRRENSGQLFCLRSACLRACLGIIITAAVVWALPYDAAVEEYFPYVCKHKHLMNFFPKGPGLLRMWIRWDRGCYLPGFWAWYFS